MKDSTIKNILVNIKSLFAINVKRRMNEISTRLTMLERTAEAFDTIENNICYLMIMEYYKNHTDELEQYKSEIEYLCQSNGFVNFPYVPLPDETNVESGFDSMAKLPYVIHKQCQLFFPACCSVEAAVSKYKYLIQVEKLLGEGVEEGRPHQYQSPACFVSEGDVLFDIGAAEGLFALDHVQKASHVVIVENDQQWIEPLRRTFAPFCNKVTIIQKFISVSDSEKTVSLDALLSRFHGLPTFIKMDIEGGELSTIIAAKELLKTKRDIKMAIASYHKQNDYEELKTFFENLGYQTESSNGYMLFRLYDTPQPPFFRHGVLRVIK